VRPVLDEEHLEALVVLLDPDRVGTVLRLDILLPGVARLEHMAVGIHGQKAVSGHEKVLLCERARSVSSHAPKFTCCSKCAPTGRLPT